MKELSRVIYFGFIAILMLSELLLSNLYSLIWSLDATAEMMKITPSAEAIRLLILIILGGMAGVGALLSMRSFRSSDAGQAGAIGVTLTTVGMLTYAAYQFYAATYQLGAMQSMVKGVAVVYALLGIFAWIIGAELRRKSVVD